MSQRDGSHGWLQIVRGILPAGGLYAAGVLTLTYWEDINVPCGQSAGCELVSRSPLAAPAGIPIALIGALAYVALIVCAFVGLGRSGVAVAFQKVGYALAGFGALVSVGLTAYSVNVIGATCRWCLASSLIFCATLVLYALSASSKEAPSLLSVRLGRFFIVWSAFVSITAVFLTTHKLEYQPPIVDVQMLVKTKQEDLAPDRAPSIGDKHAKFLLVFFGDLQCRACKKALPVLAKEIQATPGTRLVYRYYPLKFHEFAREAAIAAECSKKTVGFWPFVWKLYDNTDYLNSSYLHEVEAWAGLGDKLVDGKFYDDEAEKKVDADHALGERLGIQGTPTIFIVQDKKVLAVSYQSALDRIHAVGNAAR